LREHREKLGPAALPFNREIAGGFLRYMDDSSHQHYSSLFRAAFSPPIVAASEPMTRAAAEKELGDMAVLSRQGKAVSPEPHLERLVSSSFLSVFFGVQPETEAFGHFSELYPRFGEQELSSPFGDEAREALEGLRHWVLLEAEVLRARGSQQVQPSALGELLRADQKMPDPTSVDNLLFIYRIASTNVTALLRWVVKTLGDHPEWVTRLRGEIDSNTHSDLSGHIVKETLRLAQSEYLYREIIEDFQFDGFTMPHKWLLRICVRESHGDSGVFRNANTFDPDRFLNRSFDSSQYSPFGFGPHACNGSHLTMMIARNWIEKLCEDFDWAVVRDGLLERDFRHWRHWRPSKSLAISISRRSDNR
jgi:cytochrome P450